MLKDRSEELENMPEEEFNKGILKFNIPDCDDPYSLNGEGVWGWATPEDKAKYEDNTYEGTITAILCNMPLEYCGFLNWGTEVRLKCHGEGRPTLDPEWISDRIREAKDAAQCVDA